MMRMLEQTQTERIHCPCMMHATDTQIRPAQNCVRMSKRANYERHSMVRGKRGEIRTNCGRTVLYTIFVLVILWMVFTLCYRANVLSVNNTPYESVRQSTVSSFTSSKYGLRSFVRDIRGDTKSISKYESGKPVGPDLYTADKVKSDISATQSDAQSQHGHKILFNKAYHGAQDEQKNTESKFHAVFSTDCSQFQDWQTLLLFHSATVVKQVGPITRIASGCTEAKKAELMALYRQLYPEYNVHFTPDYKTDAKTKTKYDFYNKPYGMMHWLDNADPPVQGGTIIALLDPDFIFLRPLTANVSLDTRTIVSAGTKLSEVFDRVEKGRPVAQQYGLGAPWVHDRNRHMNRTRICGLSSPCREVADQRQGSKHFSVGAPYILERDDMHRVVSSWVDFVPRVYEGYPDLLAEMYAYSMAAAHNRLPHLQLDHFMVSNVDMDQGEGWQWVDALGDDTCVAPNAEGIFYPDRPMPTFVHYCQFFRAAEWGFHKRRVYGDIFSCHRPMLLDPHLPHGDRAPADRRITMVDFKDRDGEIVKMSRKQVRRSAFVLCVIHTAMNAALLDYKSRMCTNSSSINYEKTVNVALITKY